MSIEQILSLVLALGVIALVVLKLIAEEMEHKLILKQTVVDLKKQYDDAYASFEAACIEADKHRYEDDKDVYAGRRLRAHDNYMYWQKTFRHYRDTAVKSGITIPGIC